MSSLLGKTVIKATNLLCSELKTQEESVMLRLPLRRLRGLTFSFHLRLSKVLDG